MTMTNIKNSAIVLFTVCSLALAGFGASHSERRNPSVLDELMPRPVRCIQSADQTVPTERLQNVSVEKGPVPGAPAATADEAYVLEIGPDGAKITAPGRSVRSGGA